MAAYIAKDGNGNQVNIVEIEVGQIDAWETATGLTLEAPPEPERTETPDPTQMERALNELGVQTRVE